MRIAYLCKRRYMGKDVINDRYARLYEIPSQLARLGHDVTAFCLAYQSAENERVTHDAAPGRLVWEARSLQGFKPGRLLAYPPQLMRRIAHFKPDLVIGASDIPHVALAAHAAHRLGVPCHIDLYDNFEGFGQARLPGMKWLLRRAVRKAALVTTTSEALRELVVDGYGAEGDVISLPSTVDLEVFTPRDKRAARLQLGLPPEALLIGTAGGLLQERGIGTLYAAWDLIARKLPNARLVLAGPFPPEFPPPLGERIHYLGQLKHTDISALFNALDVGVIYLRDTDFGRYCFPQKAYEMFSCELPVAAADIGAMRELMSANQRTLYPCDDANALAGAIEYQAKHQWKPELAIEDWRTIFFGLEKRLSSLIEATSRAHPELDK